MLTFMVIFGKGGGVRKGRLSYHTCYGHVVVFVRVRWRTIGLCGKNLAHASQDDGSLIQIYRSLSISDPFSVDDSSVLETALAYVLRRGFAVNNVRCLYRPHRILLSQFRKYGFIYALIALWLPRSHTEKILYAFYAQNTKSMDLFAFPQSRLFIARRTSGTIENVLNYFNSGRTTPTPQELKRVMVCGVLENWTCGVRWHLNCKKPQKSRTSLLCLYQLQQSGVYANTEITNTQNPSLTVYTLCTSCRLQLDIHSQIHKYLTRKWVFCGWLWNGARFYCSKKVLHLLNRTAQSFCANLRCWQWRQVVTKPKRWMSINKIYI